MGGEINWFTPKDLSNLTGKYVFESPEKITAEGYSSCSTQLLPPDSLLLSSRAPIGHLAINKLESCTNQGFKSLVPSESVDVNYLYYTIKNIVPRLKDLGCGATFKELSKSRLSDVQIPLPPLPVQQKIATILDTADALKQKDKALIAKYDELTQSLFLDMFGDPVTNPKEWKSNRLGDHIELTGGFAFKSKQFVETGVPIIKIGTANKGYFDTANFSFWPINDTEKYTKYLVYPGDLLVTLTGTVGKDDYGNIAVADNSFPVYLLNQRVAKIKVSPNLSSKFLQFCFKQKKFKGMLIKNSRGVRQANISNEDINGLKVIIPSIDLQDQFAERLKVIEQQKQQAQASLKKSEDLFNCLLQKAFKGELVS